MKKAFLPEAVNVEIILRLFADFESGTGTHVMLVSPKGELFLNLGDETVCEKFHFSHPAGGGFLREWAEELSVKTGDAKLAEPLCPFGYPVLCYSIQASNGSLGMLVACGYTFEPVDPKKVERTSRRFGFDSDSYRHSLSKIVEIPRDFARNMRSLFKMLGTAVERCLDADLTSMEQRKKLEESNRFYHSLLDNNHAIILMINPNNGRIEDASMGAAEFYGYSPGQLKMMRFAEINLSSEDEMISAIRNLDHKGVQSFFSVNRLADGSTRNVNIYLTTVTLFGHIYIFCIVQDITQQKEYEKEMRKAREKLYHVQKLEAMESLASGIAHDFNNILSSVIGSAELARMQAQDKPEVMNHVQSILKSGDRAKELVRQIMMFSRQVELEPRPIVIANQVRQVLKQFKKNLPHKIKVVSDIADEIPAVFGDPVQIQQILINLLHNASQAMGSSGTLSVSLSRIEQNVDEKVYRDVQLVVSDTGSGIAPAVRGKIFEPFFTTKDHQHHSGLGLAIVYSVVKELGGTIEISSEMGEGTSIIVKLPISETLPAELESGVSEAVYSDGARLVLVDDEDSILQIGRMMLESYGYDIDTFQDSSKAMQFMKEHGARIDAVLLDYAMPEPDGVQMIQELREMYPQLPVFIITAYYQELPKLKDITDNVIEKPLDWVKISHLLHKALHP